ncbi:MAG: MEDS domain-containing protein [Solirubrobacteraceae bacterium]
MLDRELEDATDAGACPHMAVLLRSAAELPSVLAPFYALGAKRDGWMVHRALPGEAARDGRRLAEAGLDVDGLVAANRLLVIEVDPAEAPEAAVRRWEEGLEAALARGLSGLWYSRFPVRAGGSAVSRAFAVDRLWDLTFKDRPAIALCPYVVGELDEATALDRLDTLTHFHDQVAVPEGDGFRMVGRAE